MCLLLKMANTKQITFSGDVGRFNDLILKAPCPIPQADYILCESTMETDFMTNQQMHVKNYCKLSIKHVLNKKGKLIIPGIQSAELRNHIHIRPF